jgi:hypothetical protein
MHLPGQPEPIPIESVQLDPDHKRMIIVTDQLNQQWRYLQEDGGNLTLGFPYIISNEKYQVRLFVPAAPGHLPKLLSVKDNRP